VTIGAHTFVNEDIPDGALVVVVLGRIVRRDSKGREAPNDAEPDARTASGSMPNTLR
jgi:serine acetyltransferase